MLISILPMFVNFEKTKKSKTAKTISFEPFLYIPIFLGNFRYFYLLSPFKEIIATTTLLDKIVFQRILFYVTILDFAKLLLIIYRNMYELLSGLY